MGKVKHEDYVGHFTTMYPEIFKDSMLCLGGMTNEVHLVFNTGDPCGESVKPLMSVSYMDGGSSYLFRQLFFPDYFEFVDVGNVTRNSYMFSRSVSIGFRVEDIIKSTNLIRGSTSAMFRVYDKTMTLTLHSLDRSADLEIKHVELETDDGVIEIPEGLPVFCEYELTRSQFDSLVLISDVFKDLGDIDTTYFEFGDERLGFGSGEPEEPEFSGNRKKDKKKAKFTHTPRIGASCVSYLKQGNFKVIKPPGSFATKKYYRLSSTRSMFTLLKKFDKKYDWVIRIISYDGEASNVLVLKAELNVKLGNGETKRLSEIVYYISGLKTDNDIES